MCTPTAGLIAVQVASAGLQYKIAKQQAQNEYARQKRQNEIAKRNAIQRYASEQLKIRQTQKQFDEKEYQADIKSRKARAEFIVGAGEGGVAMSGSTQALMRDYYRVQGNYNASLERNMNINISQYERTMEAIQFGQESQSTYLTPPNSNLMFASAVLNVANSYYNLQARKEAEGIK
tara:strand:+ start:6612 stop:7142 length:531 start_codon:yes stop_codon:yes gene_type:complete